MKPSLEKVHRSALLFPMMEGRPFDELVADIAEHGQREPVHVLPDGTLIDGRNRVRACEALGRTADSVLYLDDASDEAITRFVVSQNVHRRHLDEGQRARIALEIEKVFAEAARKRKGQAASGKDMANVPYLGTARDEAAAAVGVSGRSVQKAKYVTKHGVQELDDAVRTGKISLNKAEKIARKPRKQQATLVHESVVEIPKLKERRRRQLAEMSPEERRAEKDRERQAAAIADRRARAVGFLDMIKRVASNDDGVSRSDYDSLLPDGTLDELDEAIRGARLTLRHLEDGDEERKAG